MSMAEKIEKRIKKLPESMQAEVLDFMESLQRKKRESTSGNDREKGKKALLGLGEGLGEGPENLADNHDKYLY